MPDPALDLVTRAGRSRRPAAQGWKTPCRRQRLRSLPHLLAALVTGCYALR